MQTKRAWIFVGADAEPRNNRMVSTVCDVAYAVMDRDPFVLAWLDDRDLTLAQAAREIAIWESRS